MSPENVSHPPGTGQAVPAPPLGRRAAAPAGARRLRTHRGLVVLLLLALVASGAGARTWWSHRGTDIRSGTTLVDSQGMVARYGLRVSLIAVVAAGGLVEFRYQVVDPDKANQIGHDPKLAPAFVIEETGETLVMSSRAHHKADLKVGGTYFLLLANAHNAVRRGSHVTLVIGDVRLEHLQAQG